MFSVRIRLGGREYLGVLDTGATISIVAKKILPCGSLKNTMTTAAIRIGDGHVVHCCGDCEVEVPMGSRTIAHRFYVVDTEAFDFVLGIDFFGQHSQIQSLKKDVLDCCPRYFDEILQVFDEKIPKPKQQVEQEQDVH